jgi:hypothetical protein
MLTPFDIQTSLRAYLRTLGADTPPLALDGDPLNRPVAKTGTMTLAAVADGYTRAAGSFLTDRFTKGMELTPAGFSSSATRQIVGVTATKIKVDGAVPVQAAAGGRSLKVGIPTTQAWEDIQFTPVAGVTWIEEQFVAGPRWQSSVGEGGDLTLRPTLNVFVHVPSNSGLAARLYADAVLRLFAAGADIPLIAPTTPADYLKVRVDEAPTSFELIPSRFDGFSTIPVSVPLMAKTINIR